MIKDNIAGIKRRIALACAKARRDPKEIITVAVSKGRSVEEMREVLDCGITDIGENKIQEALKKHYELSLDFARDKRATSYGLKWHMIGHLQTNKVKDAIGIFNLIHSLDSLHLAREIDKQAAKINKVQDVLVEVNVSGESSKFGVRLQEVTALIEEASKLKNICVKGLMTIAPIVDSPKKARPYFRILKDLKDRIRSLRLITYDLQLSMGMTDDFEVAIEEGANIIRLGRVIFQGS